MRLVSVTFLKANSFQTAGASNLIPISSIILYEYYNMQCMRYLGSFFVKNLFMIASPSSWSTMASKNRGLLDDSGQLRFSDIY